MITRAFKPNLNIPAWKSLFEAPRVHGPVLTPCGEDRLSLQILVLVILLPNTSRASSHRACESNYNTVLFSWQRMGFCLRA